MSSESDADWELVLRAAAEFQALVPDAVLVGGTATAVYAKHRYSHDADHVLSDLEQRFSELLAFLENSPDWKTNRLHPPKLILGNFIGVETGLRQLIRSTPLETTTIDVGGATVKVPTSLEMLRIKAWLIVSRNTVRDFIDFVALTKTLGDNDTKQALMTFDDCYRDIYVDRSPGELSPLLQLARQLADPLPFDLSETEVPHYKGIVPPWDSWDNIRAECVRLATLVAQTVTD